MVDVREHTKTVGWKMTKPQIIDLRSGYYNLIKAKDELLRAEYIIPFPSGTDELIHKISNMIKNIKSELERRGEFVR